jgi:predicted ATPase
MLAEAYVKAGRPEDGLNVLEGGLAVLRNCEDAFSDADVLRAKGELLLAASPPDPAAAERCFLEAIELAGRQHARALELRAATSLARLWQRSGRVERARELLAPIHAWFTEGLHTADLRSASTLLQELGAVSDVPVAAKTA